MKKKTLLMLCVFILQAGRAFAWGPITHYHINKEAGGLLSGIFATAGIYPDAINGVHLWADAAHSPDQMASDEDYEGISYPYADRPNFAYILLGLSENATETDISLGWGGHIAADWVAHRDLRLVNFSEVNNVYDLLKLFKSGDVSDFLEHVIIEICVDIYNFHKRGRMAPAFRAYPKFIWRGFTAWKLHELREASLKGCNEGNPEACKISRDEMKRLKDEAIRFMNNSDRKITVETIKNNLAAFNAFALTEEVVIFQASIFPLTAPAILGVVKGVEDENIESVLTEAKNAVTQYWLQDKTPRGIPDPYNPLKSPLVSAKHAKLQTFASVSPPAPQQNQNSETINPDALFQQFWEDVTNNALQKGAIEIIQTDGTDENGEVFVNVETRVKDESLVVSAFQEVIARYISAPESYFHMRLGKWAKHVLIEGQSDPHIFLDFEPPTVEILSPSDLDIVNFNPLIISGNASDENFLSYTLEFGAGENPESFTKICGGTQQVQENTLCSWDTTGLSGTFTLRLSATDKNDNENVTTAKISIGSPIFLSSFGSIGKSSGQFNQPTGLFLDPQDNLYIADTQNDRIQKLDKNFNALSSISGKNLLKQPEGVFVDTAGNIFVADTMNHQIKKFDASGNLILTLGKKGNANGEFNQPVGLGVSSDNKIYGSDRQNDRIQVFDASGAFQFAFGSQGSENGQFNKPQGLFIGFGDNVFVADTLNNRLQMFTKDGQFIFSANHEAFKQPHAISMDKSINVYIADTFHHRIVKADRFGNPMFLLGTHGKEPSQFNQPQGVSVSSDSMYLYVSDTLNNRIQKFQVKLSPSPSQTLAKNTEEKKDDKELSDNDPTLASAILTAPNPVRTGDIRFVYKLTGKGKKKAKEGALSIHIEVYTLTGKRIATFSCNAVDETCNWRQSLSNGVYVYRLTLTEPGSAPESKIGKIVVVK